jgi:arylformamidase
MSWVFLSHTLDSDSVGFGGEKGFERNQVRDMNQGSTSNSEIWKFSNHIGSHVDMPRHFSVNGLTISDLSASNWIFNDVELIDLPTKDNHIITVGDWCYSISNSCELLLIKTGFEAARQTDRYWASNPGVAPELAIWLRKHRPKVRAIGFDFISLTAFSNREVGRSAHQCFLCDPDFPIIIFEDLKLSSCKSKPIQVISLPLNVKNGDGSPISMIAEL